MHNIYRGGTADVWYSGNLDDLWVEYKWIAKLPKKAFVRLDKLLSPLQQRWLEGRHEEGRNIVVILGTPEGAWVLEGAAWKEPINPEAIRTLGISKQSIADYIKKRTQIDDVLAIPRYTDNQSDLSASLDDNDDSLPDSRRTE
ncbi:MAG: hypothetical protein DRR42_09845 [Gammaproteobacteria bacterium]|nr:MAG: hypothetical protein DRR42_09845 [Gammaproteobacteria bacterium]